MMTSQYTLLVVSVLSLVAVVVSEGITPLIDVIGTFHRSGVAGGGASPVEGGIIALINPSSLFSFVTEHENELQGVFSCIIDGRCTLLLSPGANTIPETQGTGSNPVRSGYGCAAASVAAGVVILDGFETSDLSLEIEGETPQEWRNSRLGRSLCSIFAAHVATTTNRQNKIILMLCVNGDVTSLKQQQAVIRTTEDLFKEVIETKKLLSKKNADNYSQQEIDESFEFGDLYEVMLVQVQSVQDAKKVMEGAYQAMERTPVPASVSTLISDTYSYSSKSSSLLHTVLTSPRSVTSALLLCNDSYLRYSRSLRSKLAPWKNRVARNLLVDKFGSQATSLYNSVLQNYDYETCSVAGSAVAAGYRLAQRGKLQATLTRDIGELFRLQLVICEADAIRQLQRKLLKLRKADAVSKATPPKEGKDVEKRMAQSYDDNAAAVRATSFAFDTKAAELEVPPLQLAKTQSSRDVAAKLFETLNGFATSPAAQLQDMKLIEKTASRNAQIKKKQKGTEPSIDIGLNLVAMFRPDGFGNFQGFAGYNLGPYGITVGVQNDADSLEVLNQFGGMRPPFVRFQPKLNFDIEL